MSVLLMNFVLKARKDAICNIHRARCLSLKVEKVIKYSNTIQLPKTKFQHWVSSNKRPYLDELILKTCSFGDLYCWQRNSLKGPDYILHDGPPYANGVPHMGHAINKIFKDIIIRNKILRGTRVHYEPGWDCHGLPIELKALIGEGSQGISPLDLRRKARGVAQQAINDQKAVFRSWGVTADWEKKCYYTFDPSYYKNQLVQFYNLYEKGLVYRALKPVYWSPSSKTALAEAELEYNSNHKSTAVIVKLKLVSDPKNIFEGCDDNSVLIWTTTPWSLPANQAVAFNPGLVYSVVTAPSKGKKYLIAKELISEVEEKLNCSLQVVREVEGSELEGLHYLHPLSKDKLPLWPSSHVKANVGTGFVHIAPAHGPDDFTLALKNNSSILNLVDDNGCYNESAGEELRNLPVLTKGNEKVLELIGHDVLNKETITHSYPYDWRSKSPVLIRASKQWFLDTQAIKERAMVLAKEVEMHPNKPISGLIAQLESRPYWCISRQRVWGVPLPVLFDKNLEEPIINRELIQTYLELLDTKGCDFWWEMPLSEMLPKPLCSKLNINVADLQKGQDILDIWFDSGLSWSAVLKDKVADLYLEGVDQFTGWFQSSLLTSVALNNRAPFKALFVHGFAVDELGRKMSKSIGNVINPEDITHGSKCAKKPAFGVDVLRWWVAAHATQHSNVPVSGEALENSRECINKLRNTLRFLLGSLNDFTFESSEGEKRIQSLHLVDHYFLFKLYDFQKEVNALYDTFQFNRVCSTVMNFVVNDISSFYCHIIKDRLYCEEPDGHKRRAAQFVLLNCLNVLTSSFASILPILAEEVYTHHPENTEKTPYFHRIHKKFDVIGLRERQEVFRVIEDALLIKSAVQKDIPLNCNNWQLCCTIHAEPKLYDSLKILQPQSTSSCSELSELLQLSQVTLLQKNCEGFNTIVKHTDGLLCDRCRKYTSQVQGSPCDRCTLILQALGY